MTLILAAAGKRSIWLLADRRLSRYGKPWRDDACKILTVEADDGVAIVGYAGLGRTALGTEPSQWMSSVLRGRNLRLEQYFDVLRLALQRELPRHIGGNPNFGHHLVAIAYLDGEARMYTIDMRQCPETGAVMFHTTRHLQKHNSLPIFALAGTGGSKLFANRSWVRPLASLIKAYDGERVGQMPVVAQLGELNANVSRQMSDRSVSNECIIVCRHRGGGGRYWRYKNGVRRGGVRLPNIMRGVDLKAIGEVLLDEMATLNDTKVGSQTDRRSVDQRVNNKMARLPWEPDDKLR